MYYHGQILIVPGQARVVLITIAVLRTEYYTIDSSQLSGSVLYEYILYFTKRNDAGKAMVQWELVLRLAAAILP